MRKITTPVDLPEPDTVEQAVANTAKITALAAAGTIGLDEATDLANLQKSYVELKVGLDIEIADDRAPANRRTSLHVRPPY